MAAKEAGPLTPFDPEGDNVDNTTFEQILEMDDDEDDREFSKGIVYGFFEQAEQTFVKLDEALKERNLDNLSSLGHFLKGSSATLGLNKVRDSCEKIQHYGSRKDDSGTSTGDDDAHYLGLLEKTVRNVKREYAAAEKVLKGFYEGGK